MQDSSTSQDTGLSEAEAADRIASLLGPADSEDDETQDGQPSDAAATGEGDDELPDTNEGADESDDQEETDEGADEQPELYTVKVAGEDVQVTLDEALKGYSREQDYTRKTQAHAAQVREDEQRISQARDEYVAKLDTVRQIIETSQPKVDQSLRDTNPAEWSAQMLQHRQWAEQRQAVAEEQERQQAAAEREEAQRFQELEVETIATLRRDIPEWKDDAVYEAENLKLASYVGNLPNVTDETLRGLRTDPTAIATLRKAMLWDDLMSKKEGVKAKVTAAKVAKPGTTNRPPSKVQDLHRAKQRLRQSGRVDDAAAAIERMLG